jgi:late embryogenesis abundant protein
MLSLRRRIVPVALALASATSIACASMGSLGSLGRLITPPRFEQARGEATEVRLLSPGAGGGRLGGAAVRIWTRVTNPNPFGIRLSTLDGDLYLEDTHAALASFPLGLPLGANADSVIPLDLRIDFAEVPALGSALRRAVAGEPVAFRLDGTVSVDAGPLGQPSFGPSTWLRGCLARGCAGAWHQGAWHL